MNHEPVKRSSSMNMEPAKTAARAPVPEVGSGQGGSGGGGGQGEARNAVTVESAVRVALRKELMHLWACAEPSSVSVDLLDILAETLAPPLTGCLCEVANRRFPKLGVSPQDTLPAASARPAVGSLGRHALEHAELVEELQGFLSSHDLLKDEPEVGARLKRDVSMKLQVSHPWQRWLCGTCSFVLAPETVLSLCAVVVPALLAQHWVIAPAEGEDDEEAASNALDPALFESELPPAGAPQGLAKAMRCRRRVFALERELIAREEAERQRQAFEKAERDKMSTRLMDVNRQLEEKLKLRTEELRRAGQKIIEAQRSVDDARAQLAERKREIAQLKYQLEQDTSIKKDAEIREQEHTRALLRSAARENLMSQRTRDRVEKLQRCLQGVDVAELMRERSPDEEQVSLLVDQVEAEFEARMERRKELQDAALREFDVRLERKRQEYRDACRKLREANVPVAAPQLMAATRT